MKNLVVNYLNSLRDGIQNLFGRVSRTEHIFSIIAAVIIGILGAFGAIGFRYLIKLSHRFFFGTYEYSLQIISNFEWYHILVLPIIGGLIVGLIVRYIAPEVKGSGIPEVMESVALHGGIIRLRVLLSKAVAAAVTIGSGGSAGREGPIVHIGSAIGSAMGQLAGISPRKLRTFVGCGAAAAIAATFNAPIAGALFAVEVIIGDFAVPKFSPIVISSVVATVLSRYFIGDFPAFVVPPYNLVSYTEFANYALLGLAAGLTATLFMQTFDKAQNFFEGLKLPLYLKPAIGGAFVGLIAIWFPQVMGVGYESINQALWGKDVSWLLLALLILKIIATSSTLGSGGSGGIFAPSLFIGAMLGALIGDQASFFFPDSTASVGAYALVGMGALVSATTHAPITAILIIFEMTNDYRIIPAVMLASIVSVLLSTYLHKESMYTMKLVKKGVNIYEGRDLNILKGMKIRSALSKDFEKINLDTPFDKIMEKMAQSNHSIFYVTNAQNKLYGIITLKTLKQLLQEQEQFTYLLIAADLAEKPPVILLETDNLDLVMHQFGHSELDEFPVVRSPQDQELLGSISQHNIISAYNKEIFKLDLSGGMHSILSGVKKERHIEITDEIRLTEIEPPASFYNKSIKELDIRSKYNLQIILIRHSTESNTGIKNRSGTIPVPDYVIRPGDRLLVLGNQNDISKISN